MQGGSRPVIVVTEKNVVFTGAYFGASFSGARSEAAYLVAGILGSAFASWYYLMTGSAFGLWARRLLRADIAAVPMPDLEKAVHSDAGLRIVQLTRSYQHETLDDDSWEALDNAVFDLYALDETDRIVVRDGLFRASWQWKQGRLESVARLARKIFKTMHARFFPRWTHGCLRQTAGECAPKFTMWRTMPRIESFDSCLRIRPVPPR